MTLREERREVRCIQGESFALQHYNDLPAHASPEEKISALRQDQTWQRHHQEEVSLRIDALVRAIEADSGETVQPSDRPTVQPSKGRLRDER